MTTPTARLPLTLIPLLTLQACTSSTIAISAVDQLTVDTVPSIAYPPAPRSDVVDNYHGTRVPDPYRWLEDPNSPPSRTWINAQNTLTQSWLAEIPERQSIRAKLTKLWNYERFSTPYLHAGAYYFTYNDGLMNQSVLSRVHSLGDEPEVVLDPNAFSTDGTVSLGGTALSEDGRYLAYGLSDGGSDWRTWRVRDLSTGRDLSDHLEWIKWSTPAWTHDGAGFYYSRYPATETDDRLQAKTTHNKVYYHRLGTEQSEDELVYSDPRNAERSFSPVVTDDGALLLLFVSEGSAEKNRLYVKDLADPGADFIRLFDAFDARYLPIGSDGWTLWIQTDRHAPKSRVVRVDARQPEAQLHEVVPEQEATLRDVALIGGRLIATYLEDAKTAVRLFGLDGTDQGRVALPGLGTAGGFRGRADHKETFYSFSSYTAPTTLYRYSIESGESELFKRPDVAFDGGEYVTEQVFYKSRDGARVPMFLTHRKGIERDGSHPTLLYGYGGFNVSMRPFFSPTTAAWLEMGGVYAVANLRGGGEYGRKWHLAGTRQNKQNVFDDFIAAAEWLIESGTTSRERLAIAGGSNGGLLVGACLNQRPDLFGAALPAVGVHDMLRYHKFTIGWAWASDYGTSDEPEMFKALYAYSPIHNLREHTSYPATFITTADHDDRVVPAHSFKYAATMQHVQGGPDPILIRIETRAGHGAGKSTTQRIEEATDRWAFLVRALGMNPSFE